jgi:tRNA pseudouridine38-40 synthase
VKIQYLGYRLHGWQRQPNFKTVEGLIKKTLKFVLPDTKIKILGSSRTDAMVSANEAAFELFVYDHPLQDLQDFLRYSIKICLRILGQFPLRK